MSEELHPGLHPDADVLNAFLEGALPEHERAACLIHLADCAQCREVVFLARKAAEAEAPAAAKDAAVRFWRRLLRPLPVLAAAVTVILVFFSVGLYRMIGSAEQEPTVTAKAELAAPTPNTTPEKSTETPSQSDAGTQPKTVPSTTVQPTPKKPSPPGVPVEQSPQANAIASPPPSAPLPATPRPALAPPAPSVAPAPPPIVVPAAPPNPAVAQFAATPRAAVATSAGVAGTITDPAGGVIPRAQVELKNEDTGATYTAASDVRGQFNIAGMAPGRYDLSITSIGFQRFVKPSIEVQPQTIARIELTLNIGTTAETVAVTAEAPLLKTESGAVSSTRNAPAPELPLNGRMPTQFETVPMYQLPGRKPAVTFAAKDSIVVAADAEGKLFFSDNRGKSWKHIKGKWKGKVVRVASTPTVPASTNAVFELITDPASAWVSADGRNWTAAPASR